jgi:hypothetical protein
VEGQKVDFYLFFWIRCVWDQYNKVHGWLQNYSYNNLTPMKANTRCVCVCVCEREREYDCVVWLIRRYKGMSCNWHIKKQELQVVEWNIVVSDEWWFWVLNPVSSEIPLTIYIYIDGAVNNEDRQQRLLKEMGSMIGHWHAYSTLLVVTCKHKAWAFPSSHH